MAAISENDQGVTVGKVANDGTPGHSLPPPPTTFEDLRWPVGIRLQCLLNRGPRGEIISSTLIGYAVNEYLIIRTPMSANGLPLAFELGENVRVRAFSGVYACEFVTEIERVFRSPFYLHLKYPDSVRVQKLRSAPRVKVDLAAGVSVSGGPTVNACVQDLSATGAQVLASGLNASKDQIIGLRFELENPELGSEPSVIETQARVAAARTAVEAGLEGADADAQVLGVVFESIDPNYALRIANYIYLRLLKSV